MDFPTKGTNGKLDDDSPAEQVVWGYPGQEGSRRRRRSWLPLVLVAFGGAAFVADAQPLPPTIEENALRQLLLLRRVYVDHLTGGETAAQMRDILLSSLETSKLFVITENPERADAILRGAAEDLVFTESRSSSDSINARTNVGTGRTSSASRGAYAGLGIGESESESDHSTERRHEAIAAVRLVNKDGDVIWATTQESLGAKFRGASTDVADKITNKLKEDFTRARKLAVVTSTPTTTTAIPVIPASPQAPVELAQR